MWREKGDILATIECLDREIRVHGRGGAGIPSRRARTASAWAEDAAKSSMSTCAMQHSLEELLSAIRAKAAGASCVIKPAVAVLDGADDGLLLQHIRGLSLSIRNNLISIHRYSTYI